MLERRFLGRTSLLLNVPDAIRQVLIDDHARFQRTRATVRILRPLLGGAVNVLMPAGAVLVLASAAGPYSMQVTAALLVGLVVVTAVSPRTGRSAHPSPPLSPDLA